MYKKRENYFIFALTASFALIFCAISLPRFNYESRDSAAVVPINNMQHYERLKKEQLGALYTHKHLLIMQVQNRTIVASKNVKSSVFYKSIQLFPMKVFDNFIQILFDDGIRAFRNLKYRTIVMDDLQLQIVVNDKVELDKMWRNSRFINCLNLNVSTARRVIPESYVVNLAKFRDYVEQYNSTIFLFGGTLLGWYRECSFIHDTTDVDFTMKIEDLNDNLLANLPNATGMSLYWMLGRKNDSLEISVYMQNIKIDLFFLYRDTSYDWVGGMVVPKKEKLRWFYPHVDELCSGNLLGILFNVPCNVDDVLKADYGSNWRVPHSSSTFQWDRSHKNIHRVGFWKAEEWEQVYRKFSHR